MIINKTILFTYISQNKQYILFYSKNKLKYQLSLKRTWWDLNPSIFRLAFSASFKF